MSILVIVTSRAHEFMAANLLPKTSYAVGVDRVYRLISCDEPVDLAFPGIETHSFPSVEAARAWIEHDNRQRVGVH